MTKGEQALRGCKPRPMKNNLCRVYAVTNQKQVQHGCKPWLMNNKQCESVNRDQWISSNARVQAVSNALCVGHVGVFGWSRFLLAIPTPDNYFISYQRVYLLVNNNHHHHHIALVARISLTLSRHSSLSFNAPGRSSGQHPVSSHSCWMYVRAGRPAFARPCVGVHKSTSLMSSFLLLQQCPACLVRLTWIVFVIGGRWPYSWCLVGVLPPGLV